MNYIDLLNHFWKLNKDLSFTPNEKAVYFALLFKWNDLHRKNPFNYSNEHLTDDSGMSVNAMKKCREVLKSRGLIGFNSGDGRKINTIYLVKNHKKGVTSEHLSEKLKVSQDDTLPLKKVSPNDTLSEKKVSPDDDYISKLIEERIPSKDEEVIEGKEEGKSSQKNPIPFGISSVYSSMEDVEFICLNQSQVWHESMMKKFGINDQEEMKKWISEFFELQRAAGQDKRDLNDSRRHCFSWINLQIKNQKEKSSEQKEKIIQSAPASNKGVDAAMEWAGVERRKNV